jgi:hypothetical protein
VLEGKKSGADRKWWFGVTRMRTVFLKFVAEPFEAPRFCVFPSKLSEMASESPITQVSETNPRYLGQGNDQDQLIYQQQPGHSTDQPSSSFPNKLKLDLRGTRLDIDRDTLVSLPESLLIVMFPNGLILGKMHDDDYDDEDEDEGSNDSVALEDQVNYVDFDPKCLDFVLQYYRHAQQVFAEEHAGDNNSSPFQQGASNMPMINPNQHPLLTKQAIIVLREELEYFALPPSNKDNGSTSAASAYMRKLKLDCGKHLLERDQIFTALQRNISKENNVAEQHLIDMLCDSGFSRDDKWGYRAMEPMKTCIVSIALVMLKTTGPENHMATAQKLLLFWRKPAVNFILETNAMDFTMYDMLM